MQVDFSENAAIIEQDEIQSAYWKDEQVAIYTTVVWRNLGTHSYCVVSNYLQHDSTPPHCSRVIYFIYSTFKMHT